MVSRELLRLGRVKLDIVCMLMWRHFWRTLVAESFADISIHFWCDASPQVRGYELYAASLDLFAGGVSRRVLLPVVALPRYLMDAVGKAAALVWMIFLLAGPAFHSMQGFLTRVRSITTDQGTERKIADMPWFLDAWFELAGFQRPVQVPPSDWLFPRAMALPGWKHLWDLLIRRGLSSLRWFPGWLDTFKGLTSWLRHRQNIDVLAKDLEDKGRRGLAAVLKSLSLPPFANWRWSTLARLCRQLKKSIL